MIGSGAFSLDRLCVPEAKKLFIAAQKENVGNICEPGWTDVGEKSEMGLLSFYGKNLPKNSTY